MFGAPSFAWPIHGGTNIPESFLVDIQTHYGAVPFLAYSWGDPSFGNWAEHSVQKLVERGVRDLTLRLFQPRGELRAPDVMLNLHKDDVEMWLRKGVEPDLVFLNEPDIEHPGKPVQYYVDYQLECNRLARQWFGRELKMLSFPLAQDVIRTPLWVFGGMDGMFEGVDACDGIAWHHYVIRPEDLTGGTGSPEWLYREKPGWFRDNRAIYLTEFGVLTAFDDPGAPRWTDEQRITMLRGLVGRYVQMSYLAKMFYFIPLAEGQEHSQHFIDTDAEKAFFEWACDRWRDYRHWPQATSGFVTTECPVDHAEQLLVMHRLWDIRNRQLAERDRHLAEETRIADDLFSAIVDYKRAGGYQ